MSSFLKQRCVIKFLTLEGLKSVDIHKKLENVYGIEYYSYKMVHEWRQKFLKGRTNVENEYQPIQAIHAPFCS